MPIIKYDYGSNFRLRFFPLCAKLLLATRVMPELSWFPPSFDWSLERGIREVMYELVWEAQLIQGAVLGLEGT